MKLKLLVLISLLTLSQTSFASPEEISVDRGRYLVRITGCNDCHTPMYGPMNGNVPEKDWLIGVPVGWNGPWGTTYATNLRQRISQLTEDQWLAYSRALKTSPPMPFFVLNEMKENDLLSIYRFINSLGGHDQKIPDGLAPGVQPKTPYINFDVIIPKDLKTKKRS